jgi:hypothetical protein
MLGEQPMTRCTLSHAARKPKTPEKEGQPDPSPGDVAKPEPEPATQ